MHCPRPTAGVQQSYHSTTKTVHVRHFTNHSAGPFCAAKGNANPSGKDTEIPFGPSTYLTVGPSALATSTWAGHYIAACDINTQTPAVIRMYMCLCMWLCCRLDLWCTSVHKRDIVSQVRNRAYVPFLRLSSLPIVSAIVSGLFQPMYMYMWKDKQSWRIYNHRCECRKLIHPYTHKHLCHPSATVGHGGISEVYKAGLQGTLPSLVLSFGWPWSSSACSSQTSSAAFLLFQLSFWLIRKAYQMDMITWQNTLHIHQ